MEVDPMICIEQAQTSPNLELINSLSPGEHGLKKQVITYLKQ